MDYIKDVVCILGYFESFCYITKGVVHLIDKVESPKNEIIDPMEQKMIKKFMLLPTPFDFYFAYKSERKFKSTEKKYKSTR